MRIASSAPPSRLPLATLLLYALPWFAVQLCFLPMTNLVTGYYAADLGVPLLAISTILLAGRAIDALTDPLIGTLSDRTRARLGRRKPWVLAGVPVLMAGTWLLFVPPEGAGASYLFWTLSLTFLGFTLVQVPYVAWGAELSFDYDERSRIAGWREGVGVAGTLTAIASPVVAGALGYGDSLGPALRGVAVGVLVLLPLFAALALLRVPEHPPAIEAEAAPGFWRGLGIVWQNREFRWFMAALIVAFLGVAPGGAVGYLMVIYAFGGDVQTYGLLVLGEFSTMLLGVPFWTWAAGRFGKHRAIAMGFGWMALFTAPIPLLVGNDPMIVVALTTLRGLGFGAAFVVIYAMIADVVDVDTLRTGRQRSGLYMAVGGFFLKAALMVGTAFALAWPAWFGFDQNAEAPTGAFHLAVSYAWISCFFWLLALPLFWTYPLTRARQAALRAAIEDARSGHGLDQEAVDAAV